MRKSLNDISEPSTFLELIEAVRDKVQTHEGNEDGLVVDSSYWLECQGIVICKSIQEEQEEQETLIQGRLYTYNLGKYMNKWQNGLDSEGRKYQETMDFHEFLRTTLWDVLSESERQELLSLPTVEFYTGEQLEAFELDRVNAKRNLVYKISGQPMSGKCNCKDSCC